jgi:UDP-N-acetylmuramyl pentapeptide phosphotransferase/UDP-N-acetylglucosamine-1-phosphate transferase
VPWLPLVLSLVVAALLAQPLLADLRERGLTRENYRGARVPSPSGVVVVLAALLTFGPLVIATLLLPEAELINPFTGTALLYVIGVAFLGLLDDLLGSARSAAGDTGLPRGWRGHARAVAGGRISTGLLKAVGALALAIIVLAGTSHRPLQYAVAVLLVVVTTNLFNLLDLRPGRSIKVFVLLGIGLVVAYLDYLEPFWALGVFIGPVLVLLAFDLRERGMLGDTGSNAVGAVAGLWMAAAMPFTAQLVALAVVTAITVYAEFRSLTDLIERTPGLRQLDSLGRADA